MRSSHGPLLGPWNTATAGLSCDRATSVSAEGDPAKSPSIVSLSTGQLAARKPTFSHGGATKHSAADDQEQASNAEHSRGIPRKRCSRAVSNSEHRWAGDVSLGVTLGDDDVNNVVSTYLPHNGKP